MHKTGLSPCEQPRPRCAPSFSSVCPSFLFSRVCSGSAAVSMNAQYHTATMANTLLVKWLTSHQLFVEPQEADDKRELLFCTEPRSTVSTTRCLADNVRTASKNVVCICYRRVSIFRVVAVVGPCRGFGFCAAARQQAFLECNKEVKGQTLREEGASRMKHLLVQIGLHARGFL